MFWSFYIIFTVCKVGLLVVYITFDMSFFSIKRPRELQDAPLLIRRPIRVTDDFRKPDVGCYVEISRCRPLVLVVKQ